MDYIDGFVAAVPNKNKQAYLEHAKLAAECFKEYGAKKLVECWGDDVPEGSVTSFPKAVLCEADETIVFSWVVWPSKEVRNAGMEKLMQDERMHPDNNPMPFDGKRLIYGGFQMILES
ncbi:DUF1428 domain-containing protein [Paraglaciecola aestuariivivens]